MDQEGRERAQKKKESTFTAEDDRAQQNGGSSQLQAVAHRHKREIESLNRVRKDWQYIAKPDPRII